MLDFSDLYTRLMTLDLEDQLPGSPEENTAQLDQGEIRLLAAHASLLSLSDSHTDQHIAYETTTRLIELLKETNPEVLSIVDTLLSRLGNFPGQELLRTRYIPQDSKLPRSISSVMENIARRSENTVSLNDEADEVLTDFQYDLYRDLTGNYSVSVSAPTSSGKSHVLTLSLQKRFIESNLEQVVYVVPTRALISEVSHRLRSSFRRTGINDVVIRSAPFPLTREDAKKKGAIYILTQERLMSFLSSNDDVFITAAYIDEAHEIQNKGRGIILQNAIDLVLERFPTIPILFASPLINNPEYFIDLFKTGKSSKYLVESFSPVTQNLMLIEPVHRKPRKANIQASLRGKNVSLGQRQIPFKFRGSKAFVKASFGRHVTQESSSTILFCNTPRETELVAEKLCDILPNDYDNDDELIKFHDFIKEEIHKEYPLAEFILKGVAFHYGTMPAIVRSGVENLFRKEKISFMCCTSTLLQGVNLPAKNIVIDNPKSGDNSMTRADFLNLSGRAGRLLKEFHGNIWCLKPSEWDSPVYQGEELTAIESAMDSFMADGGNSVQKLFDDQIDQEQEKENAEIAFGRLYLDYVEKGEDQIRERYLKDNNEESLDTTIRICDEMDISIPRELLRSHKAIRPDQLQKLYERIKKELFIEEVMPLHPFKEGSKFRFEKILGIISECFEWEIHPNYFKFLSYFSYQWVKGDPLGELIAKRVNYVRSNDSKRSVSSIIREMLKMIEQDIRFRLEKYFSAYSDILNYALTEIDDQSCELQLEPYHIYLEFGACDKGSLNIMALGLSRFTTLQLMKIGKIRNAAAETPEDFLEAIKQNHFSRVNLPTVCENELQEILGE